MRVTYTIKSAVKALKSNMTRSGLTILGIVIGISSIILVVSVSEGATGLILNQIEGLGSTLIFIEPGREPKGPSDFAQALSDSLKDRELRSLNTNNIPDLKNTSPAIILPATLSFEGETKDVSVLGTSPIYQDMLAIYPAQGNFISDDDVSSRASVVVIGYKVKEELFGLSDAIGKKIKIKNKNFKIIGVFPKKGQVAFFDIDNMAIIPYTTTKEYLVGSDHYNLIMAEVNSDESIKRSVQDIEITLRNLHNITDPEKDDFHVTTQEDIVDRVGTITGVLQTLLGSVAAISLIVGGIGIMNIMLVSVTERTREIGLRKALGAKPKDILTQFLLEAIILTIIGGIIGIILGAFLSFIVAIILSKVLDLDWSFVFSVQAAGLGVLVAGAIGLIFGLFPARSASRKSPMEALRYE